jgi:hypothetical protein
MGVNELANSVDGGEPVDLEKKITLDIAGVTGVANECYQPSPP